MPQPLMLWKSVQLFLTAPERTAPLTEAPVMVDAVEKRQRTRGTEHREKVARLVRVLLLTDQPLMAEGLRHLIRQSEELELAAVCYDPEELEPLAEVTGADLLVVDWSPQLHSGILERVRATAPQMGMILYLRSLSLDIYHQSSRLGVRGLFDKSLSSEDLLEGLLDVARGKIVYHTTLGEAFFPAAVQPLEGQDRKLYQMLVSGLSNETIAKHMGLTTRQAESEVGSCIRRLGFRDRLQIAVDSVASKSSVMSSSCALFTARPKGAQRRSSDGSVPVA